MIDAGYIMKLDAYGDLSDFLHGETPVMCKIALIVTEKNGVTKHRLILDCKASGSNTAATGDERILLPIAWDAVRDSLHFIATKKDVDVVKYLVLDFKDAFFKVPLMPSEYKYYVAEHGGAYYVWLRVAQGSVNGPTVWGRIAAFTARMTQALADPGEFRLQLYTDGPLGVIKAPSPC